MRRSDWAGVFPALTTPFREDLTFDGATFENQVRWVAACGCRGVVVGGSLGEAPTLSQEEKLELLRCAKAALNGSAQIVAGISGCSTADAVALAKAAENAGADGLMVLPPYVYKGDWRETEHHLSAVFRATNLSSMLYNNPLAYGTDVTPEQIAKLRNKHDNFHAVKESSADIRRITQLRHLTGEALALFVGVDDVIVESVAAGADGWIAGLVNAFPAESVRLFTLATQGRSQELESLYSWFLPLLRLDTVPKFVQLIKLAQQETGNGSERVRPPRLTLSGVEREQALGLIRDAVAGRTA